MPSLQLSPRAVSWTPNPDGGAWAYSCDWLGNDIASFQIPAADCGSKCVVTSGCTHFAWNSNNGGTCWVKRNVVAPSDAFTISPKDAVCGYLKIVQPPSGGGVSGWKTEVDCQWALKCDFKGADLTSVQGPATICSSRCAGISGCTHFAWTNTNGGTCWMKSGAASQGDAIVNNGDGAMCGIMTSSNPGPAPNPPTPGPAPSSGLNVNVVNKCSSTIWPGLTAVDGNNGQPYFGNAQSANPAGFELGPGASRLLKLRTNVAAMRLWARTGCRWDSGKFVCDVGDCGNPNNNYDGSCFRGTGLGANTLFEITITPTGHTYYDLSIVDGYSIPVSVTLSGSPKQVPGAGAFSCGNPACRPNFNSCPPELKKYGPNGAVIACQSISKAINDDATRRAQPALAAAYNNIDTRSHTECSCIVGSCAGGTTAEVLGNIKNGATLGVDRTGYCCSPLNPLYKSDARIASHICYAENKPKPLNGFGGGKRYDQIFKDICPQAYSWEFDDNNSTYECDGTDVTYTVQFC
ncbi:hypothetical protein CcCBS67573_g10396 [Chytriomyces confervae]|uniref:Apple domain-containing protein n=1 Tax=Chytriomyces confervae TaxID=246404 RepID=A0A507D0N8_9FUNG|nr:hypothetical protein CcCBS67573_g10396 [Chytriomyces confervae]